MAKVALIADAATALGFSLVGADVYVVREEAELKQFWSDITKQDYAIIFLTEQFYRKMQTEVEQFNRTSLTAVTLIPSASGSLNLAKERLNMLIKKAVGKEVTGSDHGKDS